MSSKRLYLSVYTMLRADPGYTWLATTPHTRIGPVGNGARFCGEPEPERRYRQPLGKRAVEERCVGRKPSGTNIQQVVLVVRCPEAQSLEQRSRLLYAPRSFKHLYNCLTSVAVLWCAYIWWANTAGVSMWRRVAFVCSLSRPRSSFAPLLHSGPLPTVS